MARIRTGGPAATGGDASGNAAVIGVCAALVILVFGVFGQTAGYGFVNFDDDAYVYENPVVSKGVSIAGIRWAFTHVHAGNWHPLTTILHMLDCQAYGLWAGGHHLTNVLLHAACAVLLFLMLREMTGAIWRSAFVAAVFAIHPLRVESVAWVSELKDVLSGVFFMLTLRAYVRYTRRPRSRGWCAMVALWLALGLMSKPMLVTTPCVLLLLDYWPLGRLRERSQLPGLLWEKAPLFVLAALSCVATLLAQKEAIQPVAAVPLSVRAGNAVVAYVVYVGKLIYPSRLATPYPLPAGGWAAWQVIGAALLLAGLTAGAYIARRRRAWLLAGWLWYLGMLAPVIGILQVGGQAYADRYTYLPEIGLCIAGTWAAADWAGRRPYRRAALAGAASAGLCTLLIAAWRQTAYWSDSVTLMTHTVACTPDNFIAHTDLGSALLDEGRIEGAIAEYREAARINPGDEEVHYNLGDALLGGGRAREAIAEFTQTIRIDPAHGEAHKNLAEALRREGRIAEAIAEAQIALGLEPADIGAENNLALMLATVPEASLRDGARALRLATEAAQASGGNNPVVLHTLSAAYAATGQFSKAAETAQKALQLAGAQSNAALAAALLGEIKLYHAGRLPQEPH